MFDSNTLFIGNARSIHYPECEIVEETKHDKGSWVSLVRGRYSYEGEWFVCQRTSRRAQRVEVIQPKTYHYPKFDNTTDADFIPKWEYGFGFGEERSDAEAYFRMIMETSDHQAVRNGPKKRATDFQRKKVYDWEGEFYIHKDSLTKDECVSLVNQICDDFSDITNIKLQLTFRQKGGCYQRGFSEVNLSTWGMNRNMIVHEMAHWVVSNSYRRSSEIAGHGPEFVGIFMLMLEKYNGVDLLDMINSANQQGVKYVFPKGGLASFVNKLGDNT